MIFDSKIKKFYYKKNILITGGSGMIGLNLVKALVKFESKITICSIDKLSNFKKFLPAGIKFIRSDLRIKKNCDKVLKKKDHVFHLMAVKSNTHKKFKNVSSTMVSHLLCNTNILQSAFDNKIKNFMFVGSIGQYPPFIVRKEERVWYGLPTANDKYMGISKRTGEILAEAFMVEHGWKAVKILRLSNVYGNHDKFHSTDSHVIPSLIKRVSDGEYPLNVAGNGTAIRDFIHVEDVVRAMIIGLCKAPSCYPINIGSGNGVSIKKIASIILKGFGKKVNIKWKTNRPTGDHKRILSTERAKKILSFKTNITIEDGILRTIEWYQKNIKK